MSEESMADAAEYVAELRKRAELDPRALEELRRRFARRDRKPPEEFHPSSFLYMRSFDGDLGLRPFSGGVFWHSPDLLLSPVTSVGAYTTTLQAGDTYVVRCLLRNRGDLAVPSAKVELFLTNPTLGFDTRFATRLTGLGSVPSAWVPALGSGAAELLYTVPPTEAGHKCLFTRCFSFSPLEMPVDDFALDPRLDRHIAQQNLNIVGQAQAFGFNVVHAPNALIGIALRALEPMELVALRHPVLADVRPAPEVPRRGWGRLAPIGLVEPGSADLRVEEAREGTELTAADPDGIDLGTQRELEARVRAVIAAVSAGKTKMSEHRDLFTRWREMTRQARLSRFEIRLPDLGLQPGQAIGLEIAALNRNADRPETFGGITLVIVA